MQKSLECSGLLGLSVPTSPGNQQDLWFFAQEIPSSCQYGEETRARYRKNPREKCELELDTITGCRRNSGKISKCKL